MGIFDSLLGLHTASAENAASGRAQAYTQQVGTANEKMLRGLNLDAQGDITNYGNQAIGNVNAGTQSAIGALTSQGGQAQQQLANGTSAAVNQVLGSNGQYAPYVANGQAANGMYANSLGLNGASGNAAATGAFQASPGYQWQVDQSTDAAARKAASLGMAASGNTLDAITRLGSNLANQEYGNWQNNLNGLSNTGLSAANAVSGNNALAAGYDYNGGAAGATLAQQLGSSLGNAYTNQGTQLANLNGGMGSSLAGLNTSLGGQLSQNNQWKVGSVNNASMTNAAAQDAATTANNGIFSNLLSSGLNVLGGTGSGKALTSAFMKL